MKGLTIAGIALGVAAALALAQGLVSHHPAAAPRHAARVVNVNLTRQPSPPLAGRIEISDVQLRDAENSGLVDQPVKTILDLRHRMNYGDYVWNDRGVASGKVWIRIDLGSQLLSVFRAGHEIGTAVILYGADGLPTPTGRFPILAKWKDHKSATYDAAPMPYTLRLTNDGVAIHGSNVRWGFATHGCVGVPKDFAAKLFDVVSRGDEVLIVPDRPVPRRARNV
ncbi:MAG: hypothetical protein NVS3B5_18800 [Sphingomicrobium sp.]